MFIRSTRIALASALLLSPLTALAQQTTTSETGTGTAFSVMGPTTYAIPLIRRSGSNTPIGDITWYAGNQAPLGDTSPMIVADGRELNVADHQDLFDVIGYTYGGNGSTTFRLPNLIGRVVEGASSTTPLGTESGSATVTLDSTHLPEHSHTYTDAQPGTTEVTGTTGTAGTATPSAFSIKQPTIALNHEVIISGTFPSRSAVAPDAGSDELVIDDNSDFGDLDVDVAASFSEILAEVTISAAPGGTGLTDRLAAQGQSLEIARNQSLFSLIGTQFGGNGRIDFEVPDLQGRIAVGAQGFSSAGPGLSPVTWGEKFGTTQAMLSPFNMPSHLHEFINPNVRPEDAILQTTETTGSGNAIDIRQQGLGLNWIIALDGFYPDGVTTIETGSLSNPAVGQLALFAGGFAPRGWAFANGQSLDIGNNAALFSLLLTTYGGDGRSRFNLPDLRGRTPIGWLGATGGSANTGDEQVTLTAANLPAHSHTFAPAEVQPIPVPLGAVLLPGALIMLAGVNRRKRAAHC